MIKYKSPHALHNLHSPPDCGTGAACVGGTCSACKPGYYPSATAASGCAECGFGFYCPNGKDRNPCGTGQTTATTTATSASDCKPGCKTNAGESRVAGLLPRNVAHCSQAPVTQDFNACHALILLPSRLVVATNTLASSPWLDCLFHLQAPRSPPQQTALHPTCATRSMAPASTAPRAARTSTASKEVRFELEGCRIFFALLAKQMPAPARDGYVCGCVVCLSCRPVPPRNRT